MGAGRTGSVYLASVGVAFVSIAFLCALWPSKLEAHETATLLADVEAQTISIRFYRPAGRGPFPLIVISHGSPRSEHERSTVRLDAFHQQALQFVRKGIAVAVPIRRGYGGRGTWVEGFTSCDNPDYRSAGLATAADIDAAIKAAVSTGEVEPDRVVLVGHSAGGWGSIAAAAMRRVIGVVNFAGGRGSRASEFVCGEENLGVAAAHFGQGTERSQLWIYASNDDYFGPALAARIHSAFVAGGGRAELALVAGRPGDGHGFFNAVELWTPAVFGYLARIGFLPTRPFDDHGVPARSAATSGP